MLTSFADLVTVSSTRLSRPCCIEQGHLLINNGFHPIVSHLSQDDFVCNSTVLDKYSNLHIISGCNGSGKTTYLKQVALIVILAQLGCFVPAEKAQIPVRTSILSRIGTDDDLENGLRYAQKTVQRESICSLPPIYYFHHLPLQHVSAGDERR